jgi:hypothetical protein
MEEKLVMGMNKMAVRSFMFAQISHTTRSFALGEIECLEKYLFIRAVQRRCFFVQANSLDMDHIGYTGVQPFRHQTPSTDGNDQ